MFYTMYYHFVAIALLFWTILPSYVNSCFRSNRQIPRDRNGNTDIHEAAMDGNLEDVKNFTKIWNNYEPQNNVSGDTPLHFAAQAGHLDVVKFIYGHIYEKEPTNKVGNTPLHLAAYNGTLYTVVCNVDKGGMK